MYREEIAKLPQPIKSECYYVQDAHERWGFFTIAPTIGLIQAHTDYGTYAHRYDNFGADFKGFLIRAQSVDERFESWQAAFNAPRSRAAIAHTAAQIGIVMKHLWPIFIEQLKAERTAKVRLKADVTDDMLQTVFITIPADAIRENALPVLERLPEERVIVGGPMGLGLMLPLAWTEPAGEVA